MLAPQPLKIIPRLVEKPWGGRRLGELLNKPTPPDVRVGESWELCDLPAHVSRVATESGARADARAGADAQAGAATGARGHAQAEVDAISEDGGALDLRALARAWGAALWGAAAPVDDRFPLLLKFLDAAEPLSVQTHPRPAQPHPRPADAAHDSGGVKSSRRANSGAPGGGGAFAAAREPAVKHEAWHVVHAEPGAEVWIGFKPGVGPAELRAAAGTPALPALLRRYPAQAGGTFYLPSGTPHALGAGLVVAEVQTPSDVTYRLYDWGRRDARGAARELHLEQAIANARFDVDESVVCPAPFRDGERDGLVACESFRLAARRLSATRTLELDGRSFVAWMMLSGAGEVESDAATMRFVAGDTLLIPAAVRRITVRAAGAARLLEVKPGVT